MSSEMIGSWVTKAKEDENASSDGDIVAKEEKGIMVIYCKDTVGKGNIIMAIAEKIRPCLTALYKNVRDEDGIVMQPSRIRGIALNVAQRIVNEQEQKVA